MKERIFTVGVVSFVALLILTCLSAFAASSDNVIRIGVLGPQKFSMGEHSWWSAQIAAEEINAAGGVTVGGVKYKIELIKADSNEVLSVVDATSGAERLVTVNKVNFIIGGHRSEAALAIQEILAEKKIIFINTQAAHPALVERVNKDYNKFKYFFRVQTNSTELNDAIYAYVSMIADQIKKELGIDKVKVAIVAEKAAWTDAAVKSAPAILAKMGMETVGVWRPSPTASDVSAELNAVKASGAHIIFQQFSGPVGHVVARQWGQAKIPVALAGVNTEGGTLRHLQATGGGCDYEVVHGIFGRAVMSPKTLPLYKKFMDEHKELLSATASSYDCVYVLADAVKRAGSLDSDKVVDALEKTDYMGAMGRITFNPKGHIWAHDLKWGAKYYTMAASQWQNGELKVVWPDGKHGEAYKGVHWEGQVDYKLPPWMKSYWAGKK
jgi:branched-chain amino acid transport system substrate-binding protein